MVVDLIGELLAPVFYGVGYLFLRLVGVSKPSERACTRVSTVLFVITFIGLVFIFSRA